MDAVAELGRNPVSEHQFQPKYGDGQADTGRDCRTRLTRTNSRARTGIEKNVHFPCLTDHEQDWQPYPVGPYFAIRDDHIHLQKMNISNVNHLARRVGIALVFLYQKVLPRGVAKMCRVIHS